MLQRVMVRKGIADNLSFLSFDPEAVLSKATYVSTDGCSQTFQNEGQQGELTGTQNELQ